MMNKLSYVYGPVRSWRSGTSLGIDPIGEVSTCSFNCAYCQLGQIQNRTAEIKEYVPTQKVLADLLEAEAAGQFKFEELDVITFAGSGEPTLALNLDEMIIGIREILMQRGLRVPISILTNATLFNDDKVCARALTADLISLKLDAPNDEILRSINQPVAGVTLDSIISGIKKLMSLRAQRSNPVSLDHDVELRSPRDDVPDLQMQIMIMPKFLKLGVILSEAKDPMQEETRVNLSTGSFGLRPQDDSKLRPQDDKSLCPQDDSYVTQLANIVKELGVKKIQINTPTRPKPVSKTGEYWIETRGNHYAGNKPGDCHGSQSEAQSDSLLSLRASAKQSPDDIEFKELPVITKEQAQEIEKTFREIINDPELEIINVYK